MRRWFGALTLLGGLCLAPPAHALTWWTADAEEAREVTAALAALWPEGEVEVRVGAPPEQGTVVWREEDTVLLRTPTGERRATADLPTQVALVRSWTRSLETEDLGWVPTPPATPELPDPVPQEPAERVASHPYVVLAAGLGWGEAPLQPGSVLTAEVGTTVGPTFFGLVSSRATRMVDGYWDHREQVTTWLWAVQLGFERRIDRIALETGLRMGGLVLSGDSVDGHEGFLLLPHAGLALRGWVHPTEAIAFGPELRVGFDLQPGRLWVEPWDLPVEMNPWSGAIAVGMRIGVPPRQKGGSP